MDGDGGVAGGDLLLNLCGANVELSLSWWCRVWQKIKSVT